MIRRVGGFLSNRASEVILGTLLTVAMAMFGMGIRAQVALQERVTENALAIARNQEKIQADCEKDILRDEWFADQIMKLKVSIDVSDGSLIQRIHDLKERLDQRCDTLENLLSLLYETKDTGG
jgi:hypothetical protein